MKFVSTRTIAVIAVVAAVASIAAFHSLQSHDVSNSDPLPSLHTVCVGRLLVDLPDDVEPDGDVELYYGLGRDFKTAKFEPIKRRATRHDFDAAVASRIATLSQEYAEGTPSHNLLASTRKLDEQSVLIVAHEEPFMKGFFRAEIIFMRGQSIARVTRQVYGHDRPADIEAKLIDLISRISAFDDPSRAGKGTCLGGMAIDAGQDGEDFTIAMRSSRLPSLRMGIAINSMIATGDGGLLHRVDSKAGDLAALGATGSTLRKGKTMIADRAAEELVSAAKDHDKVVRQFDAETVLLKPSTFAEPHIHVDMTLGGQVPGGDYVDPGMSEKDSIALWDAVIKSIRVRPGAV